MNRRLWVIAMVTLALSSCAAPDADRRFGSIGTAGTGGIYYPIGGALARMLGEALPGSSFTAEVTGGSVENLNRVAQGQMDLGMAIGTTLAKGVSEQAEDYGSVRIVAPLYPNLTHVLVRTASPITTVAQLGGKTVSVGAAGSGTEQLSRDLIGAAGIELSDLDARYLSFSESSAALRDGAIDAAIFSVGAPAAAVLEATTTGIARLIGIDGPVRARLLERFSYYRAQPIPADAYAVLAEPLPTVAVMNWIIADAALDADIVVALLEALDGRRDELIAVNDIARQIDLDALERAPMPLHDATRAWLDGR